MSIEQSIEKLADAINNLAERMTQSVVNVANLTADNEGVEPEPKKPAKKAATKATKKEEPAAEPAKTETAEEDDFGGLDDGGVEEKTFTGADASAAIKALRDALAATKGAEEGLKLAKAVLAATGATHLNKIPDDQAARAVAMAVDEARKNGALAQFEQACKAAGLEV